MKRISIIMMALALVMGMSQCKKNEQTANSNNNGVEPIFTVNISNNCSKLFFGNEMHNEIPVMWNAEDIVYVAVDGTCIGFLRANGASATLETGESQAQFNGYPGEFNLDALQVGDIMEFFTLGAAVQPCGNGWGLTQVTFSYADQSVQPAVLTHGIADIPYDGDPETNFNVDSIANMNVLVKFSLNVGTDEQITIKGVKNTSVVKFDGAVSNNHNNVGDVITFRNHVGNNKVRYAVLPSNQGAVTGEIEAAGFTGTFTIPNGAAANGLIKGTINLTAN